MWHLSGDRNSKFESAPVERHLIEFNRQRVKTPEQVGREVKELVRIESVFAKQRMLAGQKADPRAILPQGTVRANLPPQTSVLSQAGWT
jgi:hypothetical protein